MIRTLDANYLSTFHLPPFTCLRATYYGFCWGLAGGMPITTDDDALTPIRLNQRREAKERRVRGQS
jgi:hypothetical protein